MTNILSYFLDPFESPRTEMVVFAEPPLWVLNGKNGRGKRYFHVRHYCFRKLKRL